MYFGRCENSKYIGHWETGILLILKEKIKTGYILLSFEERRSVLNGTIIGVQDFLKWTGINGQSMEKISTFLPVCCRLVDFRKSCLKWEKERKSTADAVKSSQVGYIFHGGWGLSGEGLSGLKNSTKLKKARCDQTKGVLERGSIRRARLGRDAVFTGPTGVWGSWAESLKVFQNQFERNITRPFCSLGQGGGGGVHIQFSDTQSF